MKIVDTNVILRFLLQDDEKQSPESLRIIESGEIFIPNEVFVEVIYVLSSVYKFTKEDIYDVVQVLLNEDNVIFQDNDIIDVAISTYANERLDIVDCMLYAYKKCENYAIETFDKRLKRLING